jgi:hypothetical protein
VKGTVKILPAAFSLADHDLVVSINVGGSLPSKSNNTKLLKLEKNWNDNINFT